MIRWIATVAVILNIIFNYYTNVKPLNGKTIGEVSNGYPTLFTPAGYAFSIWGLIYLSFIIYAVVQLLPGQRSKEIYDRLAVPLIVANVLSICWVVFFSFEQLALSVLFIFGMLFSALLLLVKAKEWVANHQKD